jgi:hypothetical protein
MRNHVQSPARDEPSTFNWSQRKTTGLIFRALNPSALVRYPARVRLARLSHQRPIATPGFHESVESRSEAGAARMPSLEPSSISDLA